jgi:Flp pilus assembly CpaE family ATPase
MVEPADIHLPAPDRPGPGVRGALVAVCGLAGGAGTSSLAYLLASDAARRERHHVLALDAGGPLASLAVLAGAEAPRSLSSASDAVANDALSGKLFANAERHLRLIARAPAREPEPDLPAVERILRDAREAHPLTVCDCGTLQREVERHIARLASHVLWVCPATSAGVRRAEAMPDGSGLHPNGEEILIARSVASAERPPKRALMRLAEHHGMALVLVPELPDPYRDPEAARSAAQVALAAIHGELER